MMTTTTPAEIRVITWLRRQDKPRTMDQIANGTSMSHPQLRAVLNRLLERPARLAVTGNPGPFRYHMADVAQVRVSILDADGNWWEPETVSAAVHALRALADDRTLGTIGADGRARIRAALDELDAALAGYPGGGGRG